MLKLVSGLFLSFGLLIGVGADAGEAKSDCCSKKLECCAKGKACCEAPAKLGCCNQAKACCARDAAWCSAVQECCRQGTRCCDEVKACCGGTTKKVDSQMKSASSCCGSSKDVKSGCAGGKCRAADR
jgi:hypothetical protein